METNNPKNLDSKRIEREYVPEYGEVVWMNFFPQAGHEHTCHRPAVVLSPAAYNGKVGLALLSPITSKFKGYPFEVPLPAGLAVHGVILADQVKSFDWRARQAKHFTTLPMSVVRKTLMKINELTTQYSGEESTASHEYIPERGDVVWLNFSPQAGHEQAERQQAVILSPATYNGKVSLALLCPITPRVKGYAFEVPLSTKLAVNGAILADQVKSMDWRARQVEYITTLPRSVVKQVLEKLTAFWD